MALCPLSNPDHTFSEPLTCILWETEREMRRSGNVGRLLSEKGVRTMSGYLLSLMLNSVLNECQRGNQQVEIVSSLSSEVAGSSRDSEASQSFSILPDRGQWILKSDWEIVPPPSRTSQLAIPLFRTRHGSRPTVKFSLSVHTT